MLSSGLALRHDNRTSSPRLVLDHFVSAHILTKILIMVKGQTKKKKRVSKHVLKSQEERETAAPTKPQVDEQIMPTLDEKKLALKKPKKSKKSKTKDPIEAASYLSAWKHREAGGVWKFNKNTQSWLIRHMYEADKVNKATFAIMLEYLTGLCAPAKARIVEVAETRALRYKRFEKDLAEKSTEVSGGETRKEERDAENAEMSFVKESLDELGDDDESRWKRLSEHDKRKDYKRARKILEILS